MARAAPEHCHPANQDELEGVGEHLKNRCGATRDFEVAANQVAVDPGKGSTHALSRHTPAGEPFRILGVDFDLQLTMEPAVVDLVDKARWKVRTVLQVQRFYPVHELLALYRARVLSHTEYITPAIYHAVAPATAG